MVARLTLAIGLLMAGAVLELIRTLLFRGAF